MEEDEILMLIRILFALLTTKLEDEPSIAADGQSDPVARAVARTTSDRLKKVNKEISVLTKLLVAITAMAPVR